MSAKRVAPQIQNAADALQAQRTHDTINARLGSGECCDYEEARLRKRRKELRRAIEAWNGAQKRAQVSKP